MSTASPLYAIVNPDPGVRMPLIGTTREAILDRSDYEVYGHYPWRLNRHGQVVTRIGGVAVHLKRLLLGLNSRNPDLVVSFRNFDKLDLRRCNLLPQSHRAACNNPNLPNRARKTSSYAGVSRNRQRGKPWVALIFVGMFDTQEDAARARDRVARFLGWPEDAMNFPAEKAADATTLIFGD